MRVTSRCPHTPDTNRGKSGIAYSRWLCELNSVSDSRRVVPRRCRRERPDNRRRYHSSRVSCTLRLADRVNSLWWDTPHSESY